MENRPKIADVMKSYGIAPKKGLGQNFILDYNVLDRIAAASPVPLEGSVVLEIGGGPGGLTRAILARNPKKLYTVEKDPRCAAALRDIADPRLEVVEADALEYETPKDADQIIANLPYNAATPLLVVWLEDAYAFRNSVRAITVLLQKEVGDRLRAGPGTKDRCRLSVIAEAVASVRAWAVDSPFDLPPSVFTPAPKVTSGLVRFYGPAGPPESPFAALTPKPELAFLNAVAQSAFSQRRKMLRSGLKKLGFDWKTIGIDGKLRPEDLTLGQWYVLGRELQKRFLNV